MLRCMEERVSLSLLARRWISFLRRDYFYPRGTSGAERKRVHECTRKQRAIVFFQRPRRLFGLCAGDVYLAMQRALAMSHASKYSVRDTPSWPFSTTGNSRFELWWMRREAERKREARRCHAKQNAIDFSGDDFLFPTFPPRRSTRVDHLCVIFSAAR